MRERALVKMEAALVDLQEDAKAEPSRERSLAITKMQEAIMWEYQAQPMGEGTAATYSPPNTAGECPKSV